MSNQTEMECTECGEAVWVEDGAYCCDCYMIPLSQLNSGLVDFPKFWIESEPPQVQP